MGGVYALVPVKMLRDSKSRLSSILDPEERVTLTLMMLEDVVREIQSSGLVSKILVVTPDERVIRFAERLGIGSFASNSGDLNTDLENALAWCSGDEAGSALIVLADLPTLSGDDLRHIIEQVSRDPIVVISPSRDGGTNVLFMHPCGLIRPSFGVGSYERHILLLKSISTDVRIYRSLGTSLDIDTPDDVRELLATKDSSNSPLKSLVYLRTIIKMSNSSI